MLGELRNIHKKVKETKRKRKRMLLEIFSEPSKKKICRRDESKNGNKMQGLNQSCALQQPSTSTTICNDSSGKLSPLLRTEGMENLEELLEEFTGDQNPSDASENQQYSSPQLKLGNQSADYSQSVEEKGLIREEERYGDLLENLIASVSPDELLFKLSIGNEIPETFAPLDKEEQPMFGTQGALNQPDIMKPATSTTDSETYDDLQEMINQPDSMERSCLKLDSTEQTNVALVLEDSGNENDSYVKSLEVDQSEYPQIRNHSENADINLDKEESHWNNQQIAMEEKLYHLQAAAEKLEIDGKLRLKTSEKFCPDQLMMERRHLSVILEDLLEEVDSLVCQKGSDGKKSRHRKQILNRRIQALAHANSCAIDEIGKIQRSLQVTEPDCWKTDSELHVNELGTLKRKLRTSESSEVLGVKRQRADDGGIHIFQDCTENDLDAPKEDFIPRAGLGQRQRLTRGEVDTEGKILNPSGCSPQAPADSKEKVNYISKEPEDPAISCELCTFTKMKMVESGKSMSSENQVEPREQVTVAKPTSTSEKQNDKLIKQKNHTAPLKFMTSENMVTCNGLSFTLQFESPMLPMQKPPLELRRKAVEFEAIKNKLGQKLENMEEVRMEWRKTHRGSVNWARKLDVEAVLEQNGVQDVSTGQDEQAKVGETENLQRRVFKKGPRPEKERKCKRWLIDQDILQDLLEQSIPTTNDTASLGHQSTETLGRDESEDCSDGDSSDETSPMSPVSLDVLGEELLRNLTSPQTSQDLSSNSSVSDFKDSDGDDYNEEQAQRIPNRFPPSQALNMPMLDLL